MVKLTVCGQGLNLTTKEAVCSSLGKIFDSGKQSKTKITSKV